jgi:hypothetical protein
MNIFPNRDTNGKQNGEKIENNTIMNIFPNRDTNGKQMENKMERK